MSNADQASTAGRSDRELQQATVGEVTPHNAAVTIVDHDPDWPRLFRREQARINAALGETAVRIEHVGSTAVPGLPAKPVVDILLAVPDSAAESSYVPALEAAGYALHIREPEWFQHRLFKGPDTDINLRVFPVGASEIDRMLRFRDHLRASAADRDYYAGVKRALAQRVWRHVQDYADAKTDVVQDILHRARFPRC